MEEKKKGGKRNNAGRKKTTNPKLTIPLYVERSKVLVFGSPEKLKERLYSFIDGNLIIHPVTAGAFDGKKMDAHVADEPGQWDKTPLTPEQRFAYFENGLRKCDNAEKIKSILREIETSDLSFFQKKNLKQLANEIGKDFFTD